MFFKYEVWVNNDGDYDSGVFKLFITYLSFMFFFCCGAFFGQQFSHIIVVFVAPPEAFPEKTEIAHKPVRSLGLKLCVYTYIYIYMCVCVFPRANLEHIW